MINHSKLLESLDYDEETGDFTYKKKLAARINIGDVAGYIDASTGYRRITVFGKKYYAHRLAFFYKTGRLPVGVDHIDHNKQNNAWNNLREADHKTNNRNLPINKRNTSGHNGISWCVNNKWRASISVGNKTINLGEFEHIEEAIKERNRANVEYGYHVNHGAR